MGERYRPSEPLRRTKEAAGFYGRFWTIGEGSAEAPRGERAGAEQAAEAAKAE